MATEPSLATLVRTWRERAMLTQEQLASRTGLGVRTIRRLESAELHRPRSDSVRLLAEALALTGAERAQLVAVARGDPAPDALPVPHQLPAPVAGFAGRDTQLRELDELLGGDGVEPGVVVISAIGGTAGVGKTALAVYWAHAVAGGFPDGQLYVNLRGYHSTGTPVGPAEAVWGFLDALGVAPQRIPPDLDGRAALYRSLLTGRRLLVLLDNARDAEQVRPLLPGTPGCLTVVTSRSPLTGLVASAGARPLTLDLLSLPEARELLARRLGTKRIAAEPTAVDDIIGYCARLPLALAIAAARATAQPAQTLAGIATELRETRPRLDALDTGDPATDIRSVLSWSYRRLSHRAARLFRALGLHPGPHMSITGAGSIAGLSAEQAGRYLDELIGAHLVNEERPGRYALHDLLREYAAELVDVDDSEEARCAAWHRMLDYYLHTLGGAQQLLHVWRDPLDLPPPQPGVTVEEFRSDADVTAWFDLERQALITLIDQAAAGFATHSWQLAWTVLPLFERQGLWTDWTRTQEIALAAAQHLTDRPAQARAHRALGLAYARTGRHTEAQHHLQCAITMYEELEDRAGQAHAHDGLSWALGLKAEYRQALHHSQQALQRYCQLDNRGGKANALNNIGWWYVELGNHRRALSCCRRALALFQQIGDPNGEAATWDSLGYAHRHLKSYAGALRCYQQALVLRRRMGNRQYEAATLTRIGDTHKAAGNHADAQAAWRQAEQILDELNAASR
jgi:tetratricopeptide (TPR) repeat protein/transcriptional regulator with XRE-family HTH domain